MQQDFVPRPTDPQRFNASQWLNWAERLGYRLYLSEKDPQGRLGIVTEVRTGPRGGDDVELWRAFQGQDSERKTNRATLIEHLVKTGRVVRHAESSAAPSAAPVPPDQGVND